MNDCPNLDNVPEEKENPNSPIHPYYNSTHILYYQCPKCSGSVSGWFGVNHNGKNWAVSKCDKCGYTYKVEIT